MSEGLWQGLISGLVGGVGQGVLEHEEKQYQERQLAKKQKLDFLQHAIDSGNLTDESQDVAMNELLGVIYPDTGKGGKSTEKKNQAKQLLQGVMLPIRLMQKIGGSKTGKESADTQKRDTGSGTPPEKATSTIPPMPTLKSKTSAQRTDEAVKLAEAEERSKQTVRSEAEQKELDRDLELIDRYTEGKPELRERMRLRRVTKQDPEQYGQPKIQQKQTGRDGSSFPEGTLDVYGNPTEKGKLYDTARYDNGMEVITPGKPRTLTADEKQMEFHVGNMVAIAQSQGLQMTEEQARLQYRKNIEDLAAIEKELKQANLEGRRITNQQKRYLDPSTKLDMAGSKFLMEWATGIAKTGLVNDTRYIESATEDEKQAIVNARIDTALRTVGRTLQDVARGATTNPNTPPKKFAPRDPLGVR